jgi:hypothetical protein
MRALDLTGKSFGRLIVLSANGSLSGRRRWLCRCECGTEKLYSASYLANDARSCGCWHREETVARLTTHGMTGTPLFSVWKGMLSRCRNPNGKPFKNYGGRGIVVCERWQTFENFYDDMASTYQDGMTIEREDNDGPYSSDNCIWATRTAQSRNRRSCYYVESPWGRITLSEAAAHVGISFCAMKMRYVRKWPPERMFVKNPSDGTSHANTIAGGSLPV